MMLRVKRILQAILICSLVQTSAHAETPCTAERALKGLCAATNALAEPDAIAIAGNYQKIDVASSFGRLVARWPRSAEGKFGKNIERELVDVLRGASKFLSRTSLGVSSNDFDAQLRLVILDDPLDPSVIPIALVGSCHPGWMVPPASIYLIASRIIGGCQGQKKAPADSSLQLRQVFLHELGHMVEHKMLVKTAPHDGLRAEGFASWFEMRAANLVEGLSSEVIHDTFLRAARMRGNTPFSGRFEDYAYGAILFAAVEKAFGVAAIRTLYESSAFDSQGLEDAMHAQFGWSLAEQHTRVERQ